MDTIKLVVLENTMRMWWRIRLYSFDLTKSTSCTYAIAFLRCTIFLSKINFLVGIKNKKLEKNRYLHIWNSTFAGWIFSKKSFGSSGYNKNGFSFYKKDVYKEIVIWNKSCLHFEYLSDSEDNFGIQYPAFLFGQSVSSFSFAY